MRYPWVALIVMALSATLCGNFIRSPDSKNEIFSLDSKCKKNVSFKKALNAYLFSYAYAANEGRKSGDYLLESEKLLLEVTDRECVQEKARLVLRIKEMKLQMSTKAFSKN